MNIQDPCSETRMYLAEGELQGLSFSTPKEYSDAILSCIYFLRTYYPPNENRNRHALYLKKSITKLPLSLQIDQNGHSYIHLPDTIQKHGGRVVKLSVSRKLQESVSRISSKIEDKETAKNEENFLLRYSGKNGIVKTFSVFTLCSEKGSDKLVILQKYYPFGTLENIFDVVDLSFSSKFDVARDIIQGLKTLHNDNVAHGNIRANTVLIDIACKKGDFCTKAVLTDFRYATKVKAKNIKLKEDIKAVGKLFYRLFYNEDLILETYSEPKKKTLDHLIWEMVHQNPALRPSAKQISKKIP